MSVSAKSLKGVDKWGKMLMDVDINEISVPNNSVPELFTKENPKAKIYVSSSGLEDAAPPTNAIIPTKVMVIAQKEVAKESQKPKNIQRSITSLKLGMSMGGRLK